MKEMFLEEIRKIEEVKKMPYLSPTEEIIKKEGIKEGIRLALEIKFGKEGLLFYDEILKDADMEELETVKLYIKSSKTIEELKDLAVHEEEKF